MGTEDELRARIASLKEDRDHLSKVIEEHEGWLQKHVRSREDGEKNLQKWRDKHAAMSSDERARLWLLRQRSIGTKTADRILTVLGGAAGFWRNVKSTESSATARVHAAQVPWKLLNILHEASSPPWETPW